MYASVKRSLTLLGVAERLAAGELDADGVDATSRPCRAGRCRTGSCAPGPSWSSDRALSVKATASAGLANSLVAASCASKPARSVPEALAIAVARRLALGVSAVISASVSYQTPTSALPKSGLSFSVVGVDDHQVEDLAGDLRGIEHLRGVRAARGSPTSSGFQVTTAVTSGVSKAATMSASEVLTTLTSRLGHA